METEPNKEEKEFENRLLHSLEKEIEEKYQKQSPDYVKIASFGLAVVTMLGSIVLQFFSLEKRISVIDNRLQTQAERIIELDKKLSNVDADGTRHSVTAEAAMKEMIKNIQRQIDQQQQFLQHHDEEMKQLFPKSKH